MKNLFIFGSTGALGYGVTKTLLKNSYDQVFLFDRRPSKFSEENITKIILEDVTREKNVSDSFKYIGIDKGSENFLFSSLGGFTGGKKITETEYDDWRKMFKLNLDAAFNISKHFINKVEGLGKGSILFTSALSSFSREKQKIAYNASKSALNYFIESLTEEIRPVGITVNGIAPFILDTPANREWVKDASQMVAPEEVGKLVSALFDNYRILSGNIFKLPGTV